MSLRSYSPYLSAIVLCSVLTGCDQSPDSQTQAPSENFGKQLQAQLIDAKAGDVIEIPAGTYELDRSLTLNVDGVTIRGAGIDKTILNFKNQLAGAEGVMVTASDFTIEDLAIEDTKGDALKISDGKNIIIRRVRAEWTGGPSTDNGAYGFYPVLTENTLIEDSVVKGASDAGIYVGQSRNIIVRRNLAEYNVAGYEIENSIGADVYENVATNNTGGILIFNMPSLTQPGHTVRIYNNKVYENNTENFAPKGGPVASVPAGSGILINSNDKVEIFDNELRDNDTAHIIISSLFTANYAEEYAHSENFDPYPEGIQVLDNTYIGGGESPGRLELKALKFSMFGLNGSLPDVLWDGIVDANKFVDGQLPEELGVCIGDEKASFINVDAGNNYSAPTTDKAGVSCQLPRLAAINLNGLGE
ncbi:parallel beta-helix domain-containing protein [Parendozoicomonas haliclonae]|uniref:Right handed beta helix domain-containing protein n=1 Tax=Parendozoicomonas haliclonae TaxID=1960125 RepID=A0A1X7ARU8_9GAMM|nr:parallel beta-helix domain-containing protein [Parendozoicomonas haliclonae]SMA50862.1 hypothetical protein EHSB41UT_04680 [Parendozoicomonas haliclonae]